MGVTRSRWFTAMERSVAIETRTVTTTYASRAASRTAAPPTPIATPRPRTRGVSEAVGVATSDGSTDRDRRGDVGDVDRDRAGLAAGAGGREYGREQLLVAGVDPQLARHVAGHPGYEGGDGGAVELHGDAVG